jgi:energy-coupling factor transport system permease protein
MKTTPHPAVQICIWVLLALLAQRLQGLPLLFLCSGLIVIALGLCAKQLMSLMRRTRWIMFSLMLIYAYTTPGTALWSQLGLLSPTIEGLLDGALQLGRLLSVLAGLAVLLTLLSLPQLIGGLYSLMYPLRVFGLSRKRFAVRLALTLEYAESVMRDTAGDWKSTIGDALNPDTSVTSHIELRQQRLGAVDVALVVIGIVIMLGIWR